MARERNLPELKSKGNWRNAPGSSTTTKKKKPVGKGAKPRTKPVRTGAGAKPRAKPNSVKAAGNQKKNQNAPAPSSQRTSVKVAAKNKENSKRDSTKSDKSVTRQRKPLDTGARSQNTSGTGYKEGSWMDRITRARRGTLKRKKKAPVPASRRKWGDQSA